jgi:Ankyrin repeats (many copies)
MQPPGGDRTLIQACDLDGATPLHVAARENRVELVAWLLKRRANVRKKDLRGLTPLDHAALAADPRNDGAQRFPGVAAMLLGHGAELTVRAAVALGDGLRVRQLIEADPDLLGQISRNGGLLTLAVKHRQPEIAQFLLDLAQTWTIDRAGQDIGETQQQFSNRLSVSLPTVGNWETTTPPRTFEALTMLATVATEAGRRDLERFLRRS